MSCKHDRAVWVRRFIQVGNRLEKRNHHKWCGDCRETVELAGHAKPITEAN